MRKRSLGDHLMNKISRIVQGVSNSTLPEKQKKKTHNFKWDEVRCILGQNILRNTGKKVNDVIKKDVFFYTLSVRLKYINNDFLKNKYPKSH